MTPKIRRPLSARPKKAPRVTVQLPPRLLSRAGMRIFVRDAVIIGVFGPAFQFIFGYLWLVSTGTMFATHHVLPVYGHTSLLSPLIWGLLGGFLLQFYRRYLSR